MDVHAAYHEIPVFVKEGAVIPLAKPVPCVGKETVFEMTVKTFGETDATFVLYDDDFETFEYEKKQNRVIIENHAGSGLTVKWESEEGSRYRFVDETQSDIQTGKPV